MRHPDDKQFVFVSLYYVCTDKKEHKSFSHILYKAIQLGSGTGKGFLIYEEKRKFFPLYEEVASHK